MSFNALTDQQKSAAYGVIEGAFTSFLKDQMDLVPDTDNNPMFYTSNLVGQVIADQMLAYYAAQQTPPAP